MLYIKNKFFECIPFRTLETPRVSYLYDCQPPPGAPNSNSIAQTVDDAVRSLGINVFIIFLIFIV